jgi:hypothetical protein
MWEDTLYQGTTDYPVEDDPVLARRGPYTLDATYTLERVDGQWQVTNLVYANQPPDWTEE